MEILRLLWLTAAGVTLIERRDGALLAPRHFPPGEERALVAWVARAPRGRWRLVVERGEEELRLERLPRLRGLDRRRLLEATAERLFPHTPYRWRERLEADAREELWCFGALADPGPVNRLLEPLRGEAVEAITSPTRLLPALLARLGEEGDRLVAWRAFGGGLRLVLVRGGWPVALRLAPEEAAMEEELVATRAYLERLGAWPEGAAEPLRLADGEGAPFADGLFVPLVLGRGRPPGYRAPRRFGEAARFARPWLLAAALAAAGWQAAEAVDAQRKAIEAEWALTRVEPAGGPGGDPAAPSARRMVAAVERAEALRPHALAAAPPMARLGRCLEAFPEVALGRLWWEAREDGTLVMVVAATLPAPSAAARVAALARRLAGEAGVVEAVVSRPPPVTPFGAAVGGVPFELRLEARVDDGWG